MSALWATHVFWGVVLATIPSLPATATVITPAVSMRTWANGFQVVLLEDHTTAVVTTHLRYRGDDWLAGNPPPLGLLSVVEELLNETLPHRREITPQLAGYLAGAIAVECTAKPASIDCVGLVPAQNLETMLWIESDRLGFLADEMGPISFERSLRNVKRKQAFRRKWFEETPLARAMLTHLFPGPNPQYPATQQALDDLESTGESAARQVLRRMTAPSNARLVIAGDVTPDVLWPLVEKYFGSLPAGKQPVAAQKASAWTPPPRLEWPAPRGTNPRLIVSWQAPWASSAQTIDRQSALCVLSRRLKATAQPRGDHEPAARAKEASAPMWLENPFVQLWLTPQAGNDVATLPPQIDAELATLAREPPSEPELAWCRQSIQIELLSLLSHISARASVVQNLIPRDESGKQGLGVVFEHLAQMQPSDVSTFVRTYLLGRPRSELFLRPSR